MALALIAALWVAGRVAFWQSPFPPVRDERDRILTAPVNSDLPPKPRSARIEGTNLRRMAGMANLPALLDHRLIEPLLSTGHDQPLLSAIQESAKHGSGKTGFPNVVDTASALSPDDSNAVSVPKAAVVPNSSVEIGLEPSRPKRWSLDSWVFFRQDGAGRSTSGQLPPTYGASQAGAVLRYRFGGAGKNVPFAYARTTSALSGRQQVDLAAGLGVRPVAKLPLVTHAEIRVSRDSGKTQLRPAAFATTQLPPVDLPLGAQGEAYFQGGYVGGDFATGFIDGQVKIERQLVDFDAVKLRVGAAAWGGAQKGVERFDVGPTASIELRLAEQPVRLSVDYRQRVAGDAQPPSGVALTLSTGF